MERSPSGGGGVFGSLAKRGTRAGRGRSVRLSRLVGSDDVSYDGSAERTLAPALAPPLLHCAVVTHTHMSAHVQHWVYGPLVADGAVTAGGGRDGGLRPLAHRRGVQRRVRLTHRLHNTMPLDTAGNNVKILDEKLWIQ